MNIALWVLQGVLAVLFAAAGMRHIIMPRAQAAKRSQWVLATPPWFLPCLGAAEVAGAVGLILPMELSILPRLSIAAAIGLAVVMGGATVFHRARKEQPQSMVTFALMLIAVFIAVGRMALAPA
jgi:hypothetical protein